MAGLYVTRFVVGKILSTKLVEDKKFGLIFYFGFPFRQRNATYKLQLCKLANLLWSRAIMALDSSKMTFPQKSQECALMCLI